jgi:phosphatidate cytidylyltransferase
MDDLHSINEAINRRVGRNLVNSTIVGVLLLVVIFGSAFYIQGAFAVLVWFAEMVAIRELKLAYRHGGIEVPEHGLQIAATVMIIATWFGRVSALAVVTAIVIPNVMAYLLIRSPKDFVKRSTASAFALFYIPFLAGFILLLAHNPDGGSRILALIVLVACNDTFAFLSGVIFGKHLIAPHVSPKKTWEGFIGAIVATMIGASLVLHFSFHKNWYIGALIGIVGVVTATFGDLIESAIKRDLGIKDMGTILPGHGGILDRIDSMLFTAPAVWFALELIKHFNL